MKLTIPIKGIAPWAGHAGYQSPLDDDLAQSDHARFWAQDQYLPHYSQAAQAFPLTHALWRSLDLNGYVTSAEANNLRAEILNPFEPQPVAYTKEPLAKEKLKALAVNTAARVGYYRAWAKKHGVTLPQNFLTHYSWLTKALLGKPIEIHRTDGQREKHIFEINLTDHDADFGTLEPVETTLSPDGALIKRHRVCFSKKQYEWTKKDGQLYGRVLEFVLKGLMGFSENEAQKQAHVVNETMRWFPRGKEDYILKLLSAQRSGKDLHCWENFRLDHLIDDAVSKWRLTLPWVLSAHDLYVDPSGSIDLNHRFVESLPDIAAVLDTFKNEKEGALRLGEIMKRFFCYPVPLRVSATHYFMLIVLAIQRQWSKEKSPEKNLEVNKMLFEFFSGLLFDPSLIRREKNTALEILYDIAAHSQLERTCFLDLIKALGQRKPPQWREYVGGLCLQTFVGTLNVKEGDKEFLNLNFDAVKEFADYLVAYSLSLQMIATRHPEMIERGAVRNLVMILVNPKKKVHSTYHEVMRTSSYALLAGTSLQVALRDKRLAEIILSEIDVVFSTPDLDFKRYAEAAAISYEAREQHGLPEPTATGLWQKDFHLARQRLLRAPQAVTRPELKELIAATQADPVMTKLLVEELLEPLVFCRADLFDVDLLNLIAGNSHHSLLKYFLFYLKNRPAVTLEAKERAEELLLSEVFILGGRPRKIIAEAKAIAVVHAVNDGLGDELIRNGQLVQSLLAENPQAQIYLWTTRPFLYEHPRVKTFNLDDKHLKRSLSRLAQQSFDVVVRHGSKNHDLDKKIHGVMRILKKRHPPRLYIETSKVGPASSCQHYTKSLELDGKNFAPHIGFEIERAQNVYEGNFRLLAELGVPFLCPHEDTSVNNVLAATPSPKALALWYDLTKSKKPLQPVAILNPFGGQASDKGITIDVSDNNKYQGVNDHNLLLAWIRGLINDGYFVLLTPNGTEWGDQKTARQILDLLTHDEKESLVITPDPEDMPAGSLKFFVSQADFLKTVEGGLMHTAAALGKEFESAFMPGSGDERWIPFARSVEQVVSGI